MENYKLQKLKSYKKKYDYSYTLGAFPTYEIIMKRPEQVKKVLVHSSYTDIEKLEDLCKEKKIPLESNNKLLAKISDKGNCYVAGIFNKFQDKLSNSRPHIVLVNPSNMGNLGTILRTAVGFGIYDIAIILPAADIFNPKTIRASMGALFRINHSLYNSFDEYLEEFKEHDLYTFMLNGKKTLNLRNIPKSNLFSLIFGNESRGLDDSFLDVGTSVIIPQTEDVDSLNLTIAVGVAAYAFTQ